jgi:hypothetical protein
VLNRIPDAKSNAHVVQLYDADEEHLIRNVGRYFSEGFALGEGALIIAGADHVEAFAAELESLGFDLQQLAREGRMIVLDAAETLHRLMLRGLPDADRFNAMLEGPLAELCAISDAGRFRAYGEMVGLLWAAGSVTAALELEDLWNGALASGSFSLFCGYPIDVFGKEFQEALIDGIVCSHSVVLSSGSKQLRDAIERAIGEVVGANTVRDLFDEQKSFQARAVLPKAEATALWVRSSLARHADAIMDRARLYYKS